MAAPTTVPFGKRCTFRAEFRNESGQLADPTTVRWKLRPPDGAETTIAHGTGNTTRPSTGLYTLAFTPSKPGDWTVRCEGLGDVEAAHEFAIHIPRPLVTSAATT